MKRNRVVLGGAVLAITMATGCGPHKEATKPLSPLVTVVSPVPQDVLDFVELTGTCASSRTVDLVARVSGYLEEVSFQDGSWVEAGKDLFVIEPKPYQQELVAAEAGLQRARAEYDRQLNLIKDDATSKATLERWQSERDRAAAQVELAKINLGYTQVTAPFSGRIGRRLVDKGNLVGPAVNTKLATLDQLTPIYVYFNSNEREVLRLWEMVRTSGVDPVAARKATVVEVGLQNEAGYPHRGSLDFIDSGVNTASGTVLMRAIFDNKERVLFPGLFARVRLTFGQSAQMLVVPNRALGNDQEGDYVLVVDSNDVVARRSVTKGPLIDAGCAIRGGLSKADRVIVSGVMRVKPGSKVTTESASVTPAAGSSPR